MLGFTRCNGQEMRPRSANIVLAPKHRVVLTQWPALEDPTNGLTDMESLFRWAKDKGYDGLEVSADDMRKRFMPTADYEEVVAAVRRYARQYGVSVPGSLYHIADGVTAEMGKRKHVDQDRGGPRFGTDPCIHLTHACMHAPRPCVANMCMHMDRLHGCAYMLVCTCTCSSSVCVHVVVAMNSCMNFRP